MNETSQMPPTGDPGGPPPTLLRHVVPIAVGAVVTIVLTAVTAGWLVARMGTPPLALDAGLRAVFTVLGCHLTARLAPEGNPRMRYAVALGVVLTFINFMAAGAVWGQVPMWHLLLPIVLPFPCAIVGGATAIRAVERAHAPHRPRA